MSSVSDTTKLPHNPAEQAAHYIPLLPSTACAKSCQTKSRHENLLNT